MNVCKKCGSNEFVLISGDSSLINGDGAFLHHCEVTSTYECECCDAKANDLEDLVVDEAAYDEPKEEYFMKMEDLSEPFKTRYINMIANFDFDNFTEDNGKYYTLAGALWNKVEWLLDLMEEDSEGYDTLKQVQKYLEIVRIDDN